MEASIGIIGGSGLSDLDGLEDARTVELATPFGLPSGPLVVARVAGVPLAFLARHGPGHRLLPSEVPYRANIYALKLLGVRQIVAVSAVGSLREEMAPLDVCVPDDLYDRTKARPPTFFGRGLVAHVPFAHPFCPTVRARLLAGSRSVVERTHDGGTYVCIEGPAFSTYAESTTYRALGFSLVGMTALPEARLAREAGVCYAILAQVTDYDCWFEGHDTVTSDMVMANVARNRESTRRILERVIPGLGADEDCGCRHALDGAIVTAGEAIDPNTRRALAAILPPAGEGGQ